MSGLVESFKNQTDMSFHVIFVDNNSSDATVEVLTRSLQNLTFTHEIIVEKEKGTGCAADTGFRYAIARHGAQYIARTDADCHVHPKWIESIRDNLIIAKKDFVAGVIKMRTDDVELSRLDRIIIPCLPYIMGFVGKYKSGIIGYKYWFFLALGNNLAITADMYLCIGGFPRTSIDTTDEDFVLSQKIRKTTKNVKYVRGMIVYNSVRRVKAYGYFNTLLWYYRRSYSPANTDIR